LLSAFRRVTPGFRLPFWAVAAPRFNISTSACIVSLHLPHPLWCPPSLSFPQGNAFSIVVLPNKGAA
jgi:hypothetical protein